MGVTHGIAGQPHLPSEVQHAGPLTTLQAGQELALQLPVLPPVPIPSHLSAFFMYPDRQSQAHWLFVHVT